VSDEDLTNFLLTLDTGCTKHRMGSLLLCSSMPVIVTQNFDIDGGVVNGSRGITKYVRYEEMEDKR